MLSLGNWLKHELVRCWLLDLAREVPSSWSLQGFDVSDMQFPHPQNLTENVSLGLLDAFDDIPDSMISTFDIVHIRAFAAVVKGGNPGPLTKNLVKLLSVFLLILNLIHGAVTNTGTLKNLAVTFSGTSSTPLHSPPIPLAMCPILIRMKL